MPGDVGVVNHSSRFTNESTEVSEKLSNFLRAAQGEQVEPAHTWVLTVLHL